VSDYRWIPSFDGYGKDSISLFFCGSRFSTGYGKDLIVLYLVQASDAAFDLRTDRLRQ
jgi:hypothetical protein